MRSWSFAVSLPNKRAREALQPHLVVVPSEGLIEAPVGILHAGAVVL